MHLVCGVTLLALCCKPSRDLVHLVCRVTLIALCFKQSRDLVHLVCRTILIVLCCKPWPPRDLVHPWLQGVIDYPLMDYSPTPHYHADPIRRA